jgi:hypothetical protein
MVEYLFEKCKVLSSKPGVVAHACIPSYLDGGDQEDQVSRPAEANS